MDVAVNYVGPARRGRGDQGRHRGRCRALHGRGWGRRRTGPCWSRPTSSKEDEVDGHVQEGGAADLGPVDLLVNNAGIQISTAVADARPARLRPRPEREPAGLVPLRPADLRRLLADERRRAIVNISSRAPAHPQARVPRLLGEQGRHGRTSPAPWPSSSPTGASVSTPSAQGPPSPPSTGPGSTIPRSGPLVEQPYPDDAARHGGGDGGRRRPSCCRRRRPTSPARPSSSDGGLTLYNDFRGTWSSE